MEADWRYQQITKRECGAGPLLAGGRAAGAAVHAVVGALAKHDRGGRRTALCGGWGILGFPTPCAGSEVARQGACGGGGGASVGPFKYRHDGPRGGPGVALAGWRGSGSDSSPSLLSDCREGVQSGGLEEGKGAGGAERIESGASNGGLSHLFRR